MTTKPDNGAAPASLEQSVEEGIAGVQGNDSSDPAGQVAQQTSPGQTPDELAPDGAELEWAGGVVRKPPTPQDRGG